MKKIIAATLLGGAIVGSAIGLTPVANAKSCAAINGEIIAHNSAFHDTSISDAAYNAEAARLDAEAAANGCR